MRRLLSGLVLSSVALLLTGCGGMTGTWAMKSIEPESAKDQFGMQMLTLAKDQTFTMYTPCGKEIGGTWTYDAKTKLLAFKYGEDKERTYKACMDGGNLVVSSAEESKDWKVVLERHKCSCGKCTCGGACGSSTEGCDPKKCPSAKE
ncbi:MAG: hypothetical protein PVJ57_22030 [Phycisphaerae bacterium]